MVFDSRKLQKIASSCNEVQIRVSPLSDAVLVLLLRIRLFVLLTVALTASTIRVLSLPIAEVRRVPLGQHASISSCPGTALRDAQDRGSAPFQEADNESVQKRRSCESVGTTKRQGDHLTLDEFHSSVSGLPPGERSSCRFF